MHPSLTSYRQSLLERLLAFLWRQWSALGVAGHAHSDDPWMVDPEALLLFSTHIARHDSRLFDEILDWLQINGSWINLQRLGRMQKEENLGEPAVLAAMAEHVAENSLNHKWKSQARRFSPPHAPAPQAAQRLFPAIPVLSEPDPIFLKYGFQRGPVELRGMSQPPRPDQPATFLFKLRALFGMQSRAEVIAWLLANEHGHPAEIARQTSYFRSSIPSILNDLATSGHFGAIRIGREKHFSILRNDDWRFLLTWQPAEAFPQWINWSSLFSGIQTLFEALGEPKLDEKSRNFQAVKLREALDQAMPALARAGRAHRLNATRDLVGTSLIDALLADIDAILG